MKTVDDQKALCEAYREVPLKVIEDISHLVANVKDATAGTVLARIMVMRGRK